MSSARRLIAGEEAAGGYSPAVVVGDHCWISGQLPLDEQGRLCDGGVGAQTRQALRQVLALLARAGFAPGDLVSVTVVLARLDDWDAMDAAYRELLAPHGFPARLAFAADGLPLGAAVEIQATAAKA